MNSVSEKLQAIHALIDAGEPQRAIAELRVLIRREPGVASWQGMMARASGAAGLHEQALVHAKRCTEMAPTHPTSWAELGTALHHLGKFEESRVAYSKGVELSPTSVIASLGLADVLADMGRQGEAVRHLEIAIQNIPGNEALLGKYSMVLGKLAKMSDALTAAEAALSLYPKSWELAQCACSAANYVVEDPQRLFDIHVRFGKVFEYKGVNPPVRFTNTDLDRPMRVGFVSPDFRAHSVSHFVEPLLAHIDRKQCELFLYCTGPSDNVTKQLRSYGHAFTDCFMKPRKELVDSIRNRQLDILIDLSGHTRGGDSALLRSRVAPLQGNYCGYPNTLGLRSVDFRLVDEVTDPTGQADQYCVEKLVRIEECFLCYQPRTESLTLDTKSVAGGPFTFGCFNAARKISDTFLGLCAAVCKAAPDARLLFKNLDFKDPECVAMIRERALAAGIAADQLVLEGPSKTPLEHLAKYQEVDIALDTFPYSGTTTTCESLLMGVPTITMAGKSHPSRVSASLLNAVKLDGCVAHSPAEFVEVALAWKNTRARGDSQRAALREQFLKSALCDGALFSARFVAALRGIWKERIAAQLAETSRTGTK